MELDPMDRPISPPRETRWRLYAGLSGAAVLALTAVGLILVRNSGVSTPAAVAEQAAVVEGKPILPQPSGYGPDPPQVEVDDDEAEPKRLADAFQAATGHRAPFTTHSKTDSVRTVPLKIIQLQFGPVLLTQDENSDGHANVGAIGIYYLRENGGEFEVTGSWPRAVEGWDWGNPPEWRLTRKFTEYPAIYAWGDFMAQGIVMASSTITELQPTGPATSDLIGTGFSDENHHGPEDGPNCVAKGRLANVRKDRSFDVVVTGSVTAVDHYVKRDGRFVARKSIEWDLPCGFK